MHTFSVVASATFSTALQRNGECSTLLNSNLWKEFTGLMRFMLDIKNLLFLCYSTMTKKGVFLLYFQQRFISMSNDLEKLHKI